MKISENGLKIIKNYEGYRAMPYLDSVGIPTIGFGTTHYENGVAVTLNDRAIDHDRASEIMEHEVNKIYGHAVNTYVQTQLTQNEFDALVSFTYNEGPQALRTSHLLRYVNLKLMREAGNEFRRWDKAGGRVLKGLKKRRNEERLLFLGEIA
jgi:lysozyme